MQKRKYKNKRASVVSGSGYSFVKDCALRAILQNWSDEKREEEFLIQGRRAEMSARELFNTGYLRLQK